MVAVTHVEALQGHRLRLRFDDGSERTVDTSDVLWGEMGEPLRDPEYFRQVRVDPDLRTVVWPNGFDLDPDVLHGDHEPVAPLFAKKFVIYADAHGRYRWKLIASNGQTIASSGESFASKANARQAAESVKETAQSAEMVLA